MKSNNKFKYTPTESPIDRVEKAFFNDAPLSSTPNIKRPLKTSYKTAARNASNKLQKKPVPKAHKPTSSDFNSLILIPVIFITSLLIAIIGIMLLDNHIYVLPKNTSATSTPVVIAQHVSVFPESIPHELIKGRIFIMVPSLTHVKVIIDTPTALNLDKQHFLLPVYTDTSDLESLVYLRDNAYQANTFSPIVATLSMIDDQAVLAPVEIPESLFSENIDIRKITQIKIELFNPTLNPAKVIVDTKIPIVDK